MPDPIVRVQGLTKVYDGSFTALSDVDLEIEEGEILALLGPNGAGKTTLISAICGLVTPTRGKITVGGHDTRDEYRKARALVGLVPQEINLEPFETVISTVRFSRGLFGKPTNDGFLDTVLDRLSLSDKRGNQTRELSGGMKRRVLIAKALSHEPRVLFLDEPTAGVDVGLRRDMWETVKTLQSSGVTIILTTHYLEEAEELADRIGIISKGQIRLVEAKSSLMERLGQKRLVVTLTAPIDAVPERLAPYHLEIAAGGCELIHTYDRSEDRMGIRRLLNDMAEVDLYASDVRTSESSLEDIFVDLVGEEPA